MKKHFVWVILMGVILLTSCDVEPIEPPVLISPIDGSSFEIDDDEILFIWASVPEAIEYNLEIYTDTSEVGFEPPFNLGTENLAETFNGDFADTVARVHIDSFTDGADYYWQVRILSKDGRWGDWSNLAKFTYKDTEVIELDLDTTYFPFGLGYEWCYERHYTYDEELIYDPIHIEEWDTVNISVIDSYRIYDTLIFNLNTEFMDVGEKVKIWNDSLQIFNIWTSGFFLEGSVIYLEPSIGNNTWFLSDTLCLSSGYQDCYSSRWRRAYRRKEVGVIDQKYGGGRMGTQPWGEYCTYRLLYFYNGTDTVYKASQSEAL